MDQINKTPKVKEYNDYRKKRILDEITELNKNDSKYTFLFWKYIDNCTERYYSKAAYKAVYQYLDQNIISNPQKYIEFLNNGYLYFNKALSTLDIINQFLADKENIPKYFNN